MLHTKLGPSPPKSLLLFLQSAPPQHTFEAFKDDCATFGMPWYCSQAQQLCAVLLVRHPLVEKYSPRKANVRAFLKYFLTQLELPDVVASMKEKSDKDIIDFNLMEAYIDYSGNTDADSQTSMCYKTFYSPVVGQGTFLPVRLASGQFANVGLALWPAAFVLVQLLLSELSGSSPVIIPHEGDLRLLELGAGVGLTPLMLHSCPAYKRRVRCCVLTDYQPELIENILFNLRSHSIIKEEIMYSSSSCSGKGEDDSLHVSEILDWTEHERNQGKLQDWGCNVILAADCIYDVSLIDSLVTTLHQGLTASKSSVAIVVQTHRQHETIKRFFDAIQKAKICVSSSYRLASLEKSFIPSTDDIIFHSSLCPDDSMPIFALIRDDIGANGSFTGGPTGSCGSGWVGPFYVQLEAVVGVHVLRLH